MTGGIALSSVSPVSWVSGLLPTGYWIKPIYMGSTGSASQSTGYVRLCPLWVAKAITVDRIGFELNTVGTAGAVVRLGIYSSDNAGMPVALLLDAGTVATDSGTGLKTITISQALTPGIYWVAYCGQVAACTPLITGNGLLVPASSATPFSDLPQGYRDAGGVAGALPNPFVLAATQGTQAIVGLRVA